MNMFMRLFLIYLRAKLRPKCGPLGPCMTEFMVLPGDLDVFRHMNNGIYFSIMDLGRVDMLIRSGLMREIRKAGYVPIVAAETIRFRRPLRVFQKYYVETRVLGWDDKAFLMEQRFLRRSRSGNQLEVMAEAVVRARFLLKRTAITSADFLDVLGQKGAPAPLMPDWVVQWNDTQAKMRDLNRITESNSAM